MFCYYKNRTNGHQGKKTTEQDGVWSCYGTTKGFGSFFDCRRMNNLAEDTCRRRHISLCAMASTTSRRALLARSVRFSGDSWLCSRLLASSAARSPAVSDVCPDFASRDRSCSIVLMVLLYQIVLPLNWCRMRRISRLSWRERAQK